MDKSINSGSDPDKNQNTQHRSLAELEGIVRTGLETYQEGGSALDEIHEHKLYRELKYKNFKTYLQERWGISRAHAYRLINAAKVAEMSPTGDKSANEHQARKRNAKTKVTAARSETASKVIIDLDAEFKPFTELVSRWEKGLAKEDSRRLL